jgi:predicted transcriptional regulator
MDYVIPKKLNRDSALKAIELRLRDGTDVKELAQSLGFTENQLIHLFFVNKIKVSSEQRKKNLRKFSEEIYNKVVEERLKPNPTKIEDIAIKLGLNKGTVKSILKTLNIRISREAHNKNHQRISDETVTRVVALREEKLSKPQIAKKLGISKAIVDTCLYLRSRTLASAETIGLSHQKYDRSLKDKVIELAKQFKTFEEISNELGVSESSIKYFLEMAQWNRKEEKLKELGFSSFAERIKYIIESKGGTLNEPYQGQQKPHSVTCDKGHTWPARLDGIINGHWCPDCVGHISKNQKEIFEFVKGLLPDKEVKMGDRTVIAPKEIDVWVPEFKIGIEHHGLWHHSVEVDPENKTKHFQKFQMAQNAGIRLIQIFEDEWLEKQHQVKGYIRAILGKQENKIGARECELERAKISSVRQFLTDNHIQGCAGHIAYALRLDGVLVAAMTFRKTNNKGRGKPEDGVWELSRYCVKDNYLVRGGGERLLKAFVDDVFVLKIVSYSDNRWSNGGFYLKHGFVEAGDVDHDYSYFKSNPPRFHKSQFRKNRIAKKFGLDMSNIAESEAMSFLGFNRIYDAGKKKWALNLTSTPSVL